MEYWKGHKYILLASASGWFLASGAGVIIRNMQVVTPEKDITIPTEGWEYSISSGQIYYNKDWDVTTADIKVNIEGTGLQWFPDTEMVVEVVHPTHPGTVVGWIIFTILLVLLLGYLYLRFVKKKSISEFCGEFRAYLVKKFNQIGIISWSF